jgi:hypothetical protein
MPYDGNYSDYQQQQQQMQMPQSNMAFNNNYMQNNSMLMNMGQSNIQATMATASYNFHQHMQDVLQGTMASAMAIYNTGRSAVDKSRETVYQDQLMGNGIFALERSTWRDVAWGTGLAGSDFGRALKIGGRRPEFMTGGEYTYQMNRSFQHRVGEMQDELVSGGMSAIGMAAGMAMPFTPVGLLAGYAIDQTLGKMIQPTLERHAATREMRQFTEMADLNQGVGQRRMGEESSDILASRFFEHDISNLKYIPIVGDMIAGRVGPEIKYKDTFKKMAQFDLMRDISPDDVDKITERVKQTAEVMDKFAGLLHTTRDKIVEIKGKFNAIGMGDAQQNSALGNLAKFTTTTGYDVDSALALQDSFTGMGRQGNYFRTGYENRQGAFGLAEVASIQSLQNSGLISKSFDAGTLGQSFYANAVNQSQDTWHRATEFGNGDITKTADYYRERGNGNIVLGMQMERLSMFGKTGDPLDAYKKNIDITIETLMKKSHMTRQAATAYILQREKTPEGAEQAFEAISGISDIGKIGSEISYVNRSLERVAPGDKIRSYKIGDVFNTLSKIQSMNTSAGNDSILENNARAKSRLDDVLLSTEITRESVGDPLYYGNRKANRDSDIKKLMQQQYLIDAGGGDGSVNEKKVIQAIREAGYAATDEQAQLIIKQYERHSESSQHRFNNTAFSNIGNNMIDFLNQYNRMDRIKLQGSKLNEYNKLFGQNINVNKLEEIKTQLDATSDPKIKNAILRKNGFAPSRIDDNGSEIFSDTQESNTVGMMAFMDKYKGMHGYNENDVKVFNDLNSMYGTMAIKDKSVLKDLGIGSSKEYQKQFRSAANDLNGLFNKGDLSKNVTPEKTERLGKELALITSTSLETGKRMAEFLENTANADEAKTFMQHVAQQDFGVLSKAAESFAANGKLNMSNDPQTQAITEFTEVCKALTKVLTK